MAMNLSEELFLNVNFNKSVLSKLQQMPSDEASKIVASAFEKKVEVSFALNNGLTLSVQSNFYQLAKMYCWFHTVPAGYNVLCKKLHLERGETLLGNVDKVLSLEDKRRFLSEELLVSKLDRIDGGSWQKDPLKNKKELGLESGKKYSLDTIFDVLIRDNKWFKNSLRTAGNKREDVISLLNNESEGFEVMFRDMYNTFSEINDNKKNLAMLYSSVMDGFYVFESDSMIRPETKDRLIEKENHYLDNVSSADLECITNLSNTLNYETYLDKKILNKLLNQDLSAMPLDTDENNEIKTSFKL